MYNLLLDDDPHRTPYSISKWMPEKAVPIYTTMLWERVWNYKEFVETIERKGLPLLVSFDHDLADEHYAIPEDYDKAITYEKFEEKTGYHAMQWMIDYIIDNNLRPPGVFVHSLNPVGRDNIANLFDNFLKHYKWQPSKESDTQMDK